MKPTMSIKTPSDTLPVEISNASTLATNDVRFNKSSKLTKKHGLIAAVGLLSIGLVVTCVLVAIRLYTDSQVEILKYSMTYKDNNGKNINQTVSVADNSVIYHVVQNGMDAWIVSDFDKNIQVTKATNTQGLVACYVSPLNRSMSDPPTLLPSTAPLMNQTRNYQTEYYSVLKDPISDIKFLGTRASMLCENIPTYWIEKNCNAVNSATDRLRVKRLALGSTGSSLEPCITITSTTTTTKTTSSGTSTTTITTTITIGC